MSWLGGAILDVIGLTLLGLVLVVLLRAGRFFLAVLPLTRERVELIERVWPVVVSVVGVLYVLVVARVLLLDEGQSVPSLVVGIGVLGAFVGLSWWVFRDVLSGMYLRAGRAVREGDHVRIEEIEGRVERLGWRAMVVVTTTDHEAIVPYSRAAQASIVRTPEHDQISPHVFEIDVPTDRVVGAVKDSVRRAALLCHWSAVVREPEMSLKDGGEKLQVTVFALDSERGYDIEAAVRRALKNGVGAKPDAKRGLGAPRQPQRPATFRSASTTTTKR